MRSFTLSDSVVVHVVTIQSLRLVLDLTVGGANCVESIRSRAYLPAQIRSMNNRFHSEAKLPWSYDYPLANQIAKNKSSANREMPLFSPLPFFRVSSEIFPPRALKYSLFAVYIGK